jgi:hypothetical protein
MTRSLEVVNTITTQPPAFLNVAAKPARVLCESCDKIGVDHAEFPGAARRTSPRQSEQSDSAGQLYAGAAECGFVRTNRYLPNNADSLVTGDIVRLAAPAALTNSCVAQEIKFMLAGRSAGRFSRPLHSTSNEGPRPTSRVGTKNPTQAQ